MQSHFQQESLPTRANLITVDRPDSSQLVDLHVYIIPKQVWKDRQNLAENEAMEQAISAGFVRVPPNLNIRDLRQHILQVCGQDERFPKDFIYLRSVGRCLTKVKAQQETDLRVKNYRPPTTFAPEIYLLEGDHDDDSSSSVGQSKSFLFRESPIQRPPPMGSPKPTNHQPLPMPATHPNSPPSEARRDSFALKEQPTGSFSNLSRASSTLSARDLAKLREEQERLRLRQLELARQRREIELEEEERRRQQEAVKLEEVSKAQRDQEEQAATRIQAAYRGHVVRREVKRKRQQEEVTFVPSRGLWSTEPTAEIIEDPWSISSTSTATPSNPADKSLSLSPFRQAANELERLQREARELARRKAEEEQTEQREAHEVVQLCELLEQVKNRRNELESTREAIIRQMQQLHAQISVRRKEERDMWKQKYLMEKKKTLALEERARASALDRTDVKTQLEQAKIELKNSIKLRHQAEMECRLLRQEIEQIRASMEFLAQGSLVTQTQAPPPPPKRHNIPISLDITLQY